MPDHKSDDRLGGFGFICLILGLVLLGVNVTAGVVLIAIAACLIGYFHGRGPRT